METVIYCSVLFAFALIKDEFLNREPQVESHLILGPGLVIAMAITGCPLIAVVYMPYLLQLAFDWSYNHK